MKTRTLAEEAMKCGSICLVGDKKPNVQTTQKSLCQLISVVDCVSQAQ